MLKKNIDLFIGFFRAGMLGYGGGPSAIPLVHKEAVERYHWLNDEEFGDILAIANTLPGPIATKMAGYIGHRVAGMMGMLVATIATVVPTVLIMVALLSYLYQIKNAGWVGGMTTAIQPVIAVMLFVLTYDYLKKSWKDQGKSLTIALTVGSIILLQFLGVHPALLIGVLLVYAFLTGKKKKEETKPEVEKREAVSK